MGNFNTALNNTSIQQTQVSQVNQSCNQNVLANLSNVDITVISSTIGNLTLTNSVEVGNLECVLNATSTNSVSNMIDNITKNVDSTIYPFQVKADSNTAINTTDIASFQQAIINQTCNQNVTAQTTNASITFIDAVTGNIVIANKAIVSDSTCNLSASTYQQAVNSVTNDTEQKVSCPCISGSLLLIIPVLIGVAVLPILAKAGSQQGFGQQGNADSKTTDQLIQLRAIRAIEHQNAPTGKQVSGGGDYRPKSL